MWEGPGVCDPAACGPSPPPGRSLRDQISFFFSVKDRPAPIPRAGRATDVAHTRAAQSSAGHGVALARVLCSAGVAEGQTHRPLRHHRTHEGQGGWCDQDRRPALGQGMGPSPAWLCGACALVWQAKWLRVSRGTALTQSWGPGPAMG